LTALSLDYLNHAFTEKRADGGDNQGDEGDDLWGGVLKQVRISKTIK
jgi:hypothetical protein